MSDSEEYDDPGPSNLAGFLFGNLDEDNKLDAEYLDAVRLQLLTRVLAVYNRSELGVRHFDHVEGFHFVLLADRSLLAKLNHHTQYFGCVQDVRDQLQGLGANELGLAEEWQVRRLAELHATLSTHGSSKLFTQYNFEKIVWQNGLGSLYFRRDELF